MEVKKTFGERCKDGWNRHKCKIMIAGSVILMVAGGYLIVKHGDEILEFINGLCDGKNLQSITDDVVDAIPEVTEVMVLESIGETREVPVCRHFMKLPEGKHASETAKAYAKEHGLTLVEGMTVRRESVRKIAA